MALIDQVFEVIKGTGTQFLKDIWQPEDLLQLKFIGEKLIGVETRLLTATTQEDKDNCREDASQWTDQIKALALSRVNVGLQDIRDKIESAFVTVLLNGISPYLGAVVSILKAVED